jgi:hypothetical protein
MNNPELIKKIESMSLEELCEFYRSAKTASRLVDVIGVSILFGMILFYSIVTLIPGALIVYVMAQLAAGMGRTSKLIEDRILNLTDK